MTQLLRSSFVLYPHIHIVMHLFISRFQFPKMIHFKIYDWIMFVRKDHYY